MAAEHYQATFVDTATTPASVLRVKIPGFDYGVGTFQVTWTPLGNALPAAGDQALVVEADDGTWWAVAWWSAAQATVDSAGFDARLDAIEAGPEAVTTVSVFTGTWVNFSAGLPATFYRDRGRVYLAGALKSGVSGTSAFTLPVGYRPAASLEFPAVASGGVAEVIVGSAGTVTPANIGASAVATAVYLVGISFRYT